MKIVAFYRGKLSDRRGTPIRVSHLLSGLARTEAIELTIFSWDEELPLPASHVRLFNKHLKEGIALVRFMRKNKTDVILGHTVATWPYLLLARLFTRAKVVLEMHGFLEEEGLEYGSYGSLRYRAYRALAHRLYALCDLITASGEAASQELRKYNKNVVTIFGGADMHVFRPDVAPASYVPRGGLVIGYAGNLRKWQGIEFLIRSFEKLKVLHPEFRLAILSSEGKRFTQNPEIEVYPSVPPEEVPAFLAACDMLVIPRPLTRVTSLNTAGKLIEYLAMGRVVVASETGDCAKIIEDDVSGLLYPPDDEEKFLEVMVRLKDSALRERLCRKARESVEHTFTWERQAALLAECVRTV
ncbi:MAG: glycosyltransferase family 4 protein [Candidatus Kaiserbacteria bacterium]|nr:MAG: glycosyltransferase family 4 protein [Candidatus Kaiserbacteria bacterium]